MGNIDSNILCLCFIIFILICNIQQIFALNFTNVHLLDQKGRLTTTASDLLWNYDIDFTQFRSYLRSMNGNNFFSYGNMTCQLPPSAAILVYSNAGLFPFILLQKKAMMIGGSYECLNKILIVLCMDLKALELCKQNNFHNCLPIKLPFDTPLSEYAIGVYHFMTWVKHLFLYEAIKELDEVFLFDSDVLIFKNPFEETRFGRHETGERFLFNYDIRYQRDLGRGSGCKGNSNSGQIWVRNRTRTQDYFHCMMSKKDLVRIGNELDQHYVHQCAVSTNTFRCVLDPNTFTHKAHRSVNHNPRSLLRNIVTYHAAGGQRGSKHKIVRMERIIEAYQNEPNAVIGTFAD